MTYHGLDSGEATTFPHIVLFAPFAAPTSEWLFVPRLQKRSLEIVLVWTHATLRDHNILLRPLIAMRSKTNL
jgi:hypothetical protein